MLYKLLIFLKIRDQLHLVDSFYDEDLDFLKLLSNERKENNHEYHVFLITYKSIAAETL